VLKHLTVAIMAASALASPAVAQTAAGAQTAPNYSSGDRNEKICESIAAIGSRLAKKRVCATRAEWEEKKRLDREAVDQAQRLLPGPCQITPASRNGGPVAC
jgi:hypothetical protein